MYDVGTTDIAPGNEAVDARGASTGDAAAIEYIRTWLVAKTADLLSIAPEAMDAQEPLSNFGLSSMNGMILSGDIEEWLGLQLDPMVLWEYPTIEALARYLSQEVTAQQVELSGF